MKDFYHITFLRYLPSILSEGLRPSLVTGNRIEYDGVKGNPNFIYFFNKKTLTRAIEIIENDSFVTTWNKDDCIIVQVSLPKEFPVERDYDQVLHCLDYLYEKEWKFEWIIPFFSNLDIDFKGELERKNLIDHVDMVSDDVWEDMVGSYRTSSSITPEYLKPVDYL